MISQRFDDRSAVGADLFHHAGEGALCLRFFAGVGLPFGDGEAEKDAEHDEDGLEDCRSPTHADGQGWRRRRRLGLARGFCGDFGGHGSSPALAAFERLRGDLARQGLFCPCNGVRASCVDCFRTGADASKRETFS